MLGILAVLAAAVSPATAHASLRISVPGLHPAFRPVAHDYTVDCAKPVSIGVRAPGATRARIGGSRWIEGSGRRTLGLRPGQAVRVVARGATGKTMYSLRCLPDDFPEYSFRRYAKPASDFYLLTPALTWNSPYVAIFDRRGVPVWWYRDHQPPFDAKVMPDGTLVWARYGSLDADLNFRTDPAASYEFHTLDGRKFRELRTVAVVTDGHDIQQTADGNYLLMAYVERPEPVDLSAYEGVAEGHVLDGVIQEVTPKGKLVWQWSTDGHIDLSETGRWWGNVGGDPYDYAHINAVEPLPGGDLLASFRNVDAVYRIDRDTGEIEWKLGGTPTPQSLKVAGDPLGDYPLGAQHDVRYLGHGRISLFDNATDLDYPPRAVRYRIEDGTATLIDSRTEPAIQSSICCGSARFTGGSALIDWGGTGLVTEADRTGSRTLEFDFQLPFSYRAVPVNGVLSRRDLRAGMDAQRALAR